MCFGEPPKTTRQRRVLPGISAETADATAERTSRSLISVPKVDRLLRRRWLTKSPKAQIIGGGAAYVSANALGTTRSTFAFSRQKVCDGKDTIASTREARAFPEPFPLGQRTLQENASTPRGGYNIALPVFSLSRLRDLCDESGLSASEHAFLFVHKKRVALIFPPLSW